MTFRFTTAGESHGRGLVGILEGIPAGLAISAADVDVELKRRQGGYGRGARMKIESDRIEWLSGVRAGETLGSPIAMLIWNRDWEHWQDVIRGIAAAKAAGDTLGGVVEVIALGVPVGLGSHVSWESKLDGRLAQALMSIPAVKGVELGLGFEAARRKGSEVHDEIMPGF